MSILNKQQLSDALFELLTSDSRLDKALFIDPVYKDELKYPEKQFNFAVVTGDSKLSSRNINQIILSQTDAEDNRWFTSSAIVSHGLKFKPHMKENKGTYVDMMINGYIARCYNGFAFENISTYSLPKEDWANNRRPDIENLIRNKNIKIHHNQPNYKPPHQMLRGIFLPPPFTFKSASSYYETLFHELAHTTQYHLRPDSFNSMLESEKAVMRDERKKNEIRAREEIIAEGTALILSDYFNLNPDKTISVAHKYSSLAYISGFVHANGKTYQSSIKDPNKEANLLTNEILNSAVLLASKFDINLFNSSSPLHGKDVKRSIEKMIGSKTDISEIIQKGEEMDVKGDKITFNDSIISKIFKNRVN